jgi:hypothetical protein
MRKPFLVAKFRQTNKWHEFHLQLKREAGGDEKSLIYWVIFMGGGMTQKVQFVRRSKICVLFYVS